MSQKSNSGLSRRDFMKISAAAAAGFSIFPGLSCGSQSGFSPLKRRFGRTNFQVTTLGLGGQSSLQWTPEGEDPVKIIRKAIDLGINYFDTSNVYGTSQENYGKAFKELNLVPGRSGYKKALRESIFITTKSMIRWGKGGYPTLPKVRNSTDGDHGEGAVADLKRTLTQLFGDNNGNYHEDAYVDMILIHNLTNPEEVDILYKGLETPLDQKENFGSLVALRDYRDGTNHTGLNPDLEKRVKHLGFSGHYSAPVMMDMIRRDQWNLLDGMLVAINVNDRRYLNMQYNVIELAKAKDIGVVGMKVFSDGAMYTKAATWSNKSEHVVLSVGNADLPSKPLIEYVLTTPGVDTLIIGIGHVDNDPLKCQLSQNFNAAQIEPDSLTQNERRELENLGLKAKNGKSNYFQIEDNKLTPPGNIRISKQDKLTISWDTALAGDEPLSHYEILKDGKIIKEVKHFPQLTTKPFSITVDLQGKEFAIASVDKANRKAISEIIRI